MCMQPWEEPEPVKEEYSECSSCCSDCSSSDFEYFIFNRIDV